MFGGLALWSYTTKRYLNGWGTFLMALFGQLIGVGDGSFSSNNTSYWATTALGSRFRAQHRASTSSA